MLEVGQEIGNYRVVRQLGQGGMGAVFEAIHKEIGRRVAIKVLHAHFSQDPQFATRFLNEARAANIVDHPGIVEIFEFGRQPDATTYIIMEFLKGDSLQKHMRQLGQLAAPDTLRIGRQIASALAAAHVKGIVHRDLKPDNVVLVPDPEAPGGQRAKLLDFGIAKLTEDRRPQGADTEGGAQGHGLTQTGALLGTPTYMAPEQCRGAGGVTDRADVYSLGVMLYHMLAGRPPFSGQGMGEVMAAHLLKDPPPLRDVEPGVPKDLSALIHRMLVKDPLERMGMGQVVVELERLGASRTGAGQSVPTLPSRISATLLLRERGLSPFVIGVCLLAVVAAAAAFSVVWLHRGGTVAVAVAPRPAAIRWTLRTEPGGALIVRHADGQVLGKTPWEVQQQPASGQLVVDLRHEGFFDKQVSLDLGRDEVRQEKLVPIADKEIKILE